MRTRNGLLFKMLTPNYITSHLCGRLGNQMFQIANGYAQSLRYNRQYVAPSKESNAYEFKDSVFRDINFALETTDVPDAHIVDGLFTFQEYTPHLTKPTIFKGYYQSDKYFIEYQEIIKKLFSPTSSFLEKAYKDYPQ